MKNNQIEKVYYVVTLSGDLRTAYGYFDTREAAEKCARETQASLEAYGEADGSGACGTVEVEEILESDLP
jgi:hypothetical protein